MAEQSAQATRGECTATQASTLAQALSAGQSRQKSGEMQGLRAMVRWCSRRYSLIVGMMVCSQSPPLLAAHVAESPSFSDDGAFASNQFNPDRRSAAMGQERLCPISSCLRHLIGRFDRDDVAKRCTRV